MGVSIRFRKITNGRYSAYLDIYHKGKRSYEYTEVVLSMDYSKPLKDRSGKSKLSAKGTKIMPPVKREDKEKLEILERIKLEREVGTCLK